MTNGENIKELFPNGVLTSGGNNSYYWGDDILVSKNWWNAEYKEPTTKNDLGVDAVSRQAVLDLMMQKWGENFSGDSAMQESIDAIRVLPSVTPQEPKTGYWISTETKGVRYAFWCRYKCSLCGGLSDRTNFCPNCGAKMESEDNK